MATKITIDLDDVKAAIAALKMKDDEAALAILEEVVTAGADAEAALARARRTKQKSTQESAAHVAALNRLIEQEEKVRLAAKLKSDIARLSPATLAKAKAKKISPSQLIAKRKNVRREGGAK